jgi:Flp pilus assembly secretin CpaC
MGDPLVELGEAGHGVDEHARFGFKGQAHVQPRGILAECQAALGERADCDILLDVKVYAIDHTFVRKLGLSIPNQFQVFNIPAAALAALGGQNIQDLINQLIASGGINQASQSAISALLAQQANQQNSIFSQPVATFGGGKTFFGVALGTLSGQLSLNESDVTSLEHVTLRAGQGNEAKFLLGSRIPILNAQFAPVFNTPAIAKVIGNNSFQAPFPSFNYEDIGLAVKAKPTIHNNGDVSLDLDLSIKALAGQSLNGVPVLSNRAYKGQITVQDGQAAVVAGGGSRRMISAVDQAHDAVGDTPTEQPFLDHS